MATETSSVDPTSAPTFVELGADPQIAEALAADGITHAFPIQEQCIPLALQGTDLIGQAKTGTGKTLGFGIPLLQRMVVAGQPRVRRPPGRRPGQAAGPRRLPDARARPPGRHRHRARRPPQGRPRPGHLRRSRLRAADRGAAERHRRHRRHAGPHHRPRQPPRPRPVARARPRPRRGRRDARHGLPARRRAHRRDDPRQAADDAVLRDHARPDRQPRPSLHDAADAPARSRHGRRERHRRRHRAARVAHPSDGQGRAARPHPPGGRPRARR